MNPIEQISIDLIKPYPKNAKKHSEEQVKLISKSIKRFGFNQPIVIDKDNIIIIGHGRYGAAKLIGLEEVPVIQIDLSEEDAKSYRLADNKLNESDWDFTLVVDELQDLEIELQELTGFDLSLFENLETLEVVDDINKEWENMPEFDNENIKPYRRVIISFENEENVKKFAKATGLNITDKTKSTYFPPKEQNTHVDKRY